MYQIKPSHGNLTCKNEDVQSSAEVISSIVFNLCHPRSVIDVGCGNGIWLASLKKYGCKVHGVDREFLQDEEMHVQKEEFTAVDIEEKRITSKNKFDLVISLEVADCLSKDRAESFIADLAKMGEVVLFSAAIPGQNKQDSVNEQLQSYWGRLFETNGFLGLDCIRPRIWDVTNVVSCYAQNTILYVRQESLAKYPALLEFYIRCQPYRIYDLVHPRIMKQRIEATGRTGKRKLKVLYTFYHGAAFAWSLVHKLSVHSDDDAYLLLGDGWDWCVGKGKFRYMLDPFVERGVFKKIYTYNNTLGRDSVKFDTLEKTESDILNGIDKCLKEQKVDIFSFDRIYSNTDGEDTLGIYFSLKKINFFWFEFGRNLLFSRSEDFVRDTYKKHLGYCAALLKHKTLFGESRYQSYILYPNSKMNDFWEGKSSIFDAEKALMNLSDEKQMMIKKAFGINEGLNFERATVVYLQSNWLPGQVYNSCDLVQSRYKSHMLYMYSSVQSIMDYYIYKDMIPILKTHPVTVYDDNLSKRFFEGCYCFPALFTGLLMKILVKGHQESYSVFLGSSVNGQMSKKKGIFCPGIWLYSIFVHKYYVSLKILSALGALYKSVGERFGSIGNQGDIMNYNYAYIPLDINSLVMVCFPDSPNSVDLNYKIVQENPNAVLKEIDINHFIIYTDVWENLTVEQLREISSEAYVGVVRISKKTIKDLEDILVPLQDEFIFFFSKNSSYLDKLKVFSASKINKAMGIELTAEIMPMEEYVKVCQDND